MYDNISNLRFTSAWSSKKTTVSDATKATITASGSAVDGTHRLKIKKLAKGTYITGGKLTNVSAGTTVGKLLGKVSGQTTSTSITGAALTDVIPAGGNAGPRDHPHRHDGSGDGASAHCHPPHQRRGEYH